MPIAVICPSCSAKLNAPDIAAGKKVKCPRCQGLMIVPQPEPEPMAFEVVDEEPARPAAPTPARTKAPARVKADVELDDEDERPRKKTRVVVDDDDDDEDDRPRKKKKKADADNSMLIRNIVGGVLLVILLGVAGYIFYDRFQKSKDDTASKSNTDDGGGAPVINPRIVGGDGPKLPAVPPPNIGGGGNPMPVIPNPGGPGGGGEPGPGEPPGGPPGGPLGPGKLIGTPGQPITLTVPAGFKVTFPGPYAINPPPDSFKKKVPHPADGYVSLDQKTFHMYLAVVVKLPPTLTEQERKKAYAEILATFSEPDEPEDKVDVLAQRKVESGGHTWDEIEMVGASKKIGSMTVKLRAMQVDNRVIVLATSAIFGKVDANSSKKFFDSFELTK
jgi:hypothetical protein